MSTPDYKRFQNLTFDAFRKFAQDPTMAPYEKIGFPKEYRDGKEELILQDICSKLPLQSTSGLNFLDIGIGCSGLAFALLDVCKAQSHKAVVVDSAEMLAHLPDAPHIEKHPGRFPEMPAFLDRYAGQIDMALTYSVIQYVFTEGSLWDFLDKALLLLKDGGNLLIGDIPNVSMRKRFFASSSGVETHKTFTGRDEKPEVTFNVVETGSIDDSVVVGLLLRARSSGYHAWVLPQKGETPMATRREDILIRKP